MARNTPNEVPNLHVRGRKSGLAGVEIDSFLHLWSRGAAGTCPSGRSQRMANGNVAANARLKVSVNEEDVALGGAASVDSTNNLLPANSIILFVVTQPLTDLSTPVNYDVGDAAGSGTPTRFATDVTKDDVSDGPAVHTDHWSGTVAIRQVAAAKIRLRPNAAGTGTIRVAVFFMSFVGGLA